MQWKKYRDSTGIRIQGLTNTVPALYHWPTKPHVNWPHDISPNTWTRPHHPLQVRIQSRILDTEKHCEMFSRCRTSNQSYCGLPILGAKCNRTRRWKNIRFNWDSISGPQEYCSCTLPLSYRTTCQLASRCITKLHYTSSKLEFSHEFLRQRNIVKCSRDA